MTKIVAYQVLDALFLDTLIKNVNRLIKDGWEPLGSITTYRQGKLNIIRYAQPMVKRSK